MKKLVKNPSILISLISASLYLLGISFYQGYAKVLNFSDTQFPLTVDKTLFQGFISVANLWSKTTLWLIIIAESILVLSLLLKYISKRIKTYSLNRESLLKTQNNYEKDSFVNFSLIMLHYSLMILIIFFSLMFILKSSENAGTATGKNFLKISIDGRIKPIEIIFKDGKVYKGCIPIVCNQHECNWSQGHFLTGDTRRNWLRYLQHWRRYLGTANIPDTRSAY